MTAPQSARSRPRRPIAAASIAAAAILGAGLSTAIAVAQPRATELSSDDDQVVLTGRVIVPEGETVGNVLVFHGPVTIDGTADGDVTEINGDVEISGTVHGDVIVLNGRTVVRSSAVIDGSLQSQVSPTIEQGATVRGGQSTVTRVDLQGLSFFSRFAVWLAVSVSTLVFGVLLILFSPRAADAVALAASERTGAAIGWGLALFFLLPVAGLIALITLVGIPLGLGILLGLALLYSLGYVASMYVVGRLVMKAPRTPYLALVVGWALARVIAPIPVLGGLSWVAGAIFGLGVLATTAKAASRGQTSLVAPAVPAPPAPPPPPPPPASAVRA